MSDKEIKKEYARRKRLLKLRYIYNSRKLKKEKQGTLENFYLENEDKRPKNPPKRPLIQEIGNSVSHGIGAVFSVVALILMLVFSESTLETCGAIIYFAGMFLMFTVSCLYHAFRYGSAVKRLFRRFDYSSIYLMIGATFAPVLLVYFNNTFGTVFFIIQWALQPSIT